MNSQLLDEDFGVTYQSLMKNKSEVLNIKYLNTHSGIKVVPLDLVLAVLKDIELRLEDIQSKLGENYEEDDMLVDNLYQDI